MKDVTAFYRECSLGSDHGNRMLWAALYANQSCFQHSGSRSRHRPSVIPFMGAYFASKHGLEGMSEALQREMMIYGIDVIMVVPGPVATAIWDKGEATDLSAYEGTIYGPIVERFRRYMI